MSNLIGGLSSRVGRGAGPDKLPPWCCVRDGLGDFDLIARVIRSIFSAGYRNYQYYSVSGSCTRLGSLRGTKAVIGI